MIVFAATVTHKHGTNLYLASSAQDREAQLADFCRQWWDEMEEAQGRKADGVCPLMGRCLTNSEVIEIYFDPENMGEHEYVELFEPEDVQ